MRWGTGVFFYVFCALAGGGFGCGETTISTLRIVTEAGSDEPDVRTVPARPDGRVFQREAASTMPPRGDAGAGEAGAWGDASDAMGPPVLDCAALRPLAGRVLTPRRPSHALFSSDGRAIALVVRNETYVHGGVRSEDLVLISLPAGNETMLAQHILEASWLGSTTRLLTRTPYEELSIVDLDGGTTRVAPKACEYTATPDGSRVYFVTDCDNQLARGVLEAFDVATGRTVVYGDVAVPSGNLAVSPDGQWFAYMEISRLAADAGSGALIHVRDGLHRDYAIDAQYFNAYKPAFVGERTLLFQLPGKDGTANVYRHDVGSTSVLEIATNFHVGFRNYRVSPDGSTLLGARWPGAQKPDELYAARLDGSTEIRLVDDLDAYQNNEFGPNVFAFSNDGSHVIYKKPGVTGTASVPAGGGAATTISSGSAFAVSPFADRVVTLETSPNGDGSVVRVGEPTSNVDRFKFMATGSIRSVTFVPADKGLLFVEMPSGGSLQLKHLSFRNGTTTPLGPQWDASLLALSGPTIGEMPPYYPVDPTGCYAVVDSDLPGTEGVSIALIPD